MKDEFMKWARPLWLFVSGMVILALTTVLYPEIGNILGTTTSQVAAEGIDLNNYWGLAFCFSSGRLLVFLIGLALVVISALWAFARGGM